MKSWRGPVGGAQARPGAPSRKHGGERARLPSVARSGANLDRRGASATSSLRETLALGRANKLGPGEDCGELVAERELLAVADELSRGGELVAELEFEVLALRE